MLEGLNEEQLKQIIEILKESNEQLFGICAAYMREDVIEKMRQVQDARIVVITNVD